MVVITAELLNSCNNQKLEENSPVVFSQRYLRQSKRISQIIAYIWRYLEEDKTAKELDRYFKNTRIGNKKYKLKDLLFANPNSEDLEEKERFKLMQKVFSNTSSPLIEPLFNEQEKEIYEIGEIDLDRHRTELKDPNPGSEKWIAVMAYPPRPLISDNGQLSAEELEKWIADDSNDISLGKRTAPNPFIPLCCS